MNVSSDCPRCATLGPVVLSLVLLVILLLLPTGFEGALAYRNADRVDALVLSTDESDLVDTGLIRSGEQRCKVRILSGQFAGTETTAVNRLNGSLAEDKLFAPGDRAFVVVSHANGVITTVYMTDHFRLDKEALLAGLFRIHGAVMESSESLLYAGYQHLDLTQIFVASIFLGASGAVMDLAVDICSAVYEVVQKKPDITPREAICSGFAVGRAAYGSTTTTLLLAYSSSFLTLLMVFMAQGAPVLLMLNYKYIAAEIVHTIVGSFGLVTVAPLTAITSGLLLTAPRCSGNPQTSFRFQLLECFRPFTHKN